MYYAGVVLLLAVVAAAIPGALAAERFEALAAERETAPYGYVFYLSRPVGRVEAVILPGERVFEWKADTTDTLRLVYGKDFDALVAEGRRIDVRIIEVEPGEYDAFILALNGSLIAVSSRNGHFYSSHYLIAWGEAPEDADPRQTVVVEPEVLRLEPGAKYVVPAAGPQDVVVVEKPDGAVIRESLAGFLGVDDACIATVPGGEWRGGLIPTPQCSRGVQVIESFSYAGQTLYSVFRVEVGGAIVYIVFGDVDIELLTRLGFLSLINRNPYIHVLPVEAADYYYFSGPTRTSLTPVDVVEAVNATSPGHKCYLPGGAEVTYRILWHRRALAGGVGLEPGEVIVYEYRGGRYACTGSLEYFYSRGYIEFPAIIEFHGPAVLHPVGEPVIVLGNGKLYYGNRTIIPFDDWYHNSIILLAGFAPRVVEPESKHIYESHVGLLLVLFTVTFASLFIDKVRKPPKKVKIVWDISEPEPEPLASRQEIVQAAKRHLDKYGVCPTDTELAMQGVLVPYEGEGPGDVVICPWRGVDQEAELTLRRLSRLLLNGFWVFRRLSRRHGIIYTRLGEVVIVFRAYVAGSGEPPEEAVLNTLRAATFELEMPGVVREYGLVLVAAPELAKRAEELVVNHGLVNGVVLNIDDLSYFLAVVYPGLDEKTRNDIIAAVRRYKYFVVYGHREDLLVTALAEAVQEEASKLSG